MLAVTIVDFPAHGTYTQGPLQGGFTYRPSSSYIGADSFTYCLTDIPGVQPCKSNVAQVKLSVISPTASADEYRVGIDTTLRVNAPGYLANDVDVGESNQLILVQPAHGRFAVGLYKGGFSYVPEAGYVGSDSMRYCLYGGGAEPCASNAVDIQFKVGAPTAVDDSLSLLADEIKRYTAGEGVLSNDLNALSTDSFSVTKTPAHGNISEIGVGGKYSFAPSPGFVGRDSFQYCISAVPNDGVCLSGSNATVTLDITAAPVIPITTPTPTPAITSLPTPSATAGGLLPPPTTAPEGDRNRKLASTGAEAAPALTALLGGLALVIVGYGSWWTARQQRRRKQSA